MQEGVPECMNVAEEGVAADSGARMSYWETVRSVEAASTLVPEGVSARSRKGFAEAVYESKN